MNKRGQSCYIQTVGRREYSPSWKDAKGSGGGHQWSGNKRGWGWRQRQDGKSRGSTGRTKGWWGVGREVDDSSQSLMDWLLIGEMSNDETLNALEIVVVANALEGTWLMKWIGSRNTIVRSVYTATLMHTTLSLHKAISTVIFFQIESWCPLN